MATSKTKSISSCINETNLDINSQHMAKPCKKSNTRFTKQHQSFAT